MKPIHTIISQTFRISAKTLMTFLAVGLGTGILILAISISDSFKIALEKSLTADGLIIHIANAQHSAEGGLNPVRPATFDQDIVEVLMNSVSGIKASAPVTTVSWRNVSVGDNQYQIRRIHGTNESYIQVMGLDLLAGSAFTEEDVRMAATKAVLSRSVAESLYGSIDAALGSSMQPPARAGVSRSEGDENAGRTTVAQLFTIVGVYEDLDEVKRRSYGIADVLIPYTSGAQGGLNMGSAMQSPWSTITVKITGQSFAAASAQIRDTLAQHYGDDVAIHIWEGQTNGTSSMLDELRNSITTFSLVINILGFVLLLTGSIGILSIMIVEVLGKTKDIAMERALGASKMSIIAEFFMRALSMSLVSAGGGVLLAYVFADPLSKVLWPIVSTLGSHLVASSIISAKALVIGIGCTLGIGGIFGSIPVFSSFRAPIAESIREG